MKRVALAVQAFVRSKEYEVYDMCKHIGFWRTLFIAVFAALGALAGGIGNKRDAVRVAINRSFPPKDKPLDIEQDTQDKTNKPE